MTLPQPPSAADRPVLGRTASRHRNVPALLLVLGGAVLVALAYTVLDWFHPETDGSFPIAGGSTLPDLHRLLVQIEDESRGVAGSALVARYYFSSWVWLLFAAVTLAALVATVSNRMATTAGMIGTLLAAAAVVLTFGALRLSVVHDEAYAPFALGYGDFLSHATLGFWLAVAGYLLAGAGALFGPPRKPKPLRI
jgi:hypothetical protein